MNTLMRTSVSSLFDCVVSFPQRNDNSFFLKYIDYNKIALIGKAAEISVVSC